jgi:hypothetical protein
MAESKKSLTPPELVGRARHQVEELFGKPVESVSGFEQTNGDEKGWTVTLELLELSRIPDTDGNLIGAHRTRRYPRNQTDPLKRQEDDE